MTQRLTIPAESLLAEVDWLRALASQLVHSEDRADDLFQDTILASLRERNPIRGPLRPWLARVSQNLAARTHRGEGRRRRREQAVARPTAQHDTHERFAMHRTVVEAVRQLDEPYATVVLMRFFDDLPPREIARRLEAPVETVKTRLKRGMHKLRVQLDQEFGDREPWVAALGPILGTKPSAAVAATGAAGTGSGIWALLSAKWLVPAAGIVLAALSAILLSDQAPRSTDPKEVAMDPIGTTHIESPEEPGTVESSSTANVAAQGPAKRAAATVPPASKTHTIRVVDAKTGKPVPNQVAYHVQPSAAQQKAAAADQMRVLRGELEFSAVIRRHARSMRTDANGQLQVPDTGAQPAQVVVLDGPLEGKLTVQAERDSEDRVLELHPVRTVDVDVVDTAGEPVSGVPIGWTDGHMPRFLTKTHKGRARVRFWFAKDLHARNGKVAIALPVGVSQSLDLDNLPSDPVRLVLPATGELTVQVFDEGGRPIRGSGLVELVDAERPPERSKAEETVRKLQRQASKSLQDRVRGKVLATAQLRSGEAFFPKVGLGQEFGVRVQMANATSPIEGTGLGPVASGHSAKITLRAGATERVIEFRVTDPLGTPIADTQLNVRLFHASVEKGRSSLHTTVQADADGRVRVPIQRPWQSGEQRSLELSTTMDEAVLPPPSARLDLSHPVGLGIHRIPDVQLTPAPVLAAGKVVDGSGRPVSDATVNLFLVDNHPSGTGIALTLRDVPPVQTKDDGAFAFYGFGDERLLRVRAQKPNHYLTTPVDVPATTTTVRLELLPAGSLEGSLAEGFTMQGLEAELHPQSGDAELRRPLRTTERTFSFVDVPPGNYRFALVMSGVPPLIELPVTVLPSQTSRPATLQSLDLRHVARTVRITLRDPNGKPLEGVLVQRMNNQRGTGWTTNDRGVTNVLVPIGGASIHVRAAAYRTVHIEGVTSDRVVDLQPRIPVDLRITGSLRADVQLHLRLRPLTKSKTPEIMQSPVAATEGRAGVREARILVSTAGEYEVRASFSERGAASTHARWTLGRRRIVTPFTLRIGDSVKPQSFELRLDPKEVAAALASYEESPARTQKRR